jgi:hypothetical protein
MKLGTIVVTSFIIGFIPTFVGGYLKITHSDGGDTWLTIGIIASIVFIVVAIYEVRTSKRIDNFEKNLWTLALIFFSGIAGMFYIFLGRTRVANSY